MQAWFRFTTLVGIGVLSLAPRASAHVSLAGPGYAGKTQVLTFGVGHGCEGADTVAIEVSIPKEVTTVRIVPNSFGKAEVHTDDAGIVKSVSWTKTDAARAKDDAFYQMSIRVAVPDAPFTTLYFPAKQTCRGADGKDLIVDWNKSPDEVAAAKEGEEVPPSPSLTILPSHLSGWNKFTTTTEIKSLAIFDDAQIVWVDDAAYSSNPNTTELIKSDSSVKALTSIPAGAEIWVKY